MYYIYIYEVVNKENLWVKIVIIMQALLHAILVTVITTHYKQKNYEEQILRILTVKYDDQVS